MLPLTVCHFIKKKYYLKARGRFATLPSYDLESENLLPCLNPVLAGGQHLLEVLFPKVVLESS